jgi:hypothetical protein
LRFFPGSASIPVWPDRCSRVRIGKSLFENPTKTRQLRLNSGLIQSFQTGSKVSINILLAGSKVKPRLFSNGNTSRRNAKIPFAPDGIRPCLQLSWLKCKARVSVDSGRREMHFADLKVGD